MKKVLFATILFALISVVPMPTMARVDVNINIGLPPPIAFAAPPQLIVIPETYVYVDPYIDVDLFFWNGWWWRLWEGRWYRSYYYNRGWRYYNNVPRFYYDVDPDWRGYYRDRNWYGHRWDHRPVPYIEFNGTGGAGKRTDIGRRGNEPGASRTINLDPNGRDRN